MQKPPLSRTVLLLLLLGSTVYFAVSRQPVTELITTGPQTINGTQQSVSLTGKLVDDWQFDPAKYEEDGAFGGAMFGQSAPGRSSMKQMNSALAPSPMASGNIGLSVGGAKDVNNFRENILNGFLPLPTDITYEGLFYDYYFDTGATEACNKLFCPSYSYAVSKDPLSEKDEYYLSVGLNSGIKESDFQRKKLNLMLVLDISGSMGSPFDQYYYDRFGNKHFYDSARTESQSESNENGKTKMEIAAKSITELMNHLQPQDRFGVVLFDDYAELAKPMSMVGNTDMKKIKDHILELSERGSTNLSSGMEMATKQFKKLAGSNQNEYENRIIFLTDAMPNRGDDSDEGMFKMVEKNASDKIYTTFIGIGVDFNTELVEILTKIRGANYYSVHSEKEFAGRMDEGFDYMVTPLVFDLNLKLEADGYTIEKVFGSPEANEATGEIMKVNTLFPSKTEDGQTKGGIVLLKLSKNTEASGSLKLKVTYEDRMGKKDGSEVSINLPANQKDYYQNSGIRKGILLTRYANLVKAWLIDERINNQPPRYEEPPRIMPAPPYPCLLVSREKGIIIPEPPHIPPCWPHPWPVLGEWERQSLPLTVAGEYKISFADFAKYLKSEMEALGDKDLQKEIDVLNKLI